MKFIEYVKFKTVLYYGTEVSVPEHIKYIATDNSGTVMGFEQKPVPDHGWKFWDNPSADDMYDIGVVDLEGIDWTSTLVEV